MIVEGSAAWLVTVFLHLGLAVGLAHVLSARLASGSWRERLWRLALGGALLTAAAQTAVGNGPLVWHWASPAAEPSAQLVQVAVPLAAMVGPGPLESAHAAAGSMQPVADPGGRGESAQGTLERWPAFAIVGGWMLGVLYFGTRQALARRRFLASLQRQRLSGRADLRERLQRLRPATLRRRRLRLSVSSVLNSPVVLSKSEICLPERALEQFGPRELDATLAHELAHVLRRDPLWLRIYAALEALFFFQPLVRRATSALRNEAELACDDWAVERGADPLGLARSLAHIAGWAPAAPVALSAMVGQETGLVRRVERLTSDPSSGSTRLRVALCFGVLALGLGAFACGGPGVSHGEPELAEIVDGAPDTLRFELTDGDELIAEGITWRLPEEDQELREYLEVRNGVDDSLSWDELSDLRVVIDVADGVRFSRVQNLMQMLASQRIWRIEFAVHSGPNMKVPLPHDLSEMDVPIEEEVVEGEMLDAEGVEVADGELWHVSIKPRDRADVILRVRSKSPREVQYALGPDKTTSLQELEELARRAHRSQELRSVLIDARPGILYADVVATIDALIQAGLTDVQLVFVGAYQD